jgi:hypothetical protein
MHVLEHVGLGRYGDPVDYDGDLRAAAELMRVLAPGGRLLMVVPLGGVARIQFNAHRIYTHAQIVGMFDELHLDAFALIPESAANGDLVADPPAAMVARERYGCGCFEWWRPRTWCRKPAVTRLDSSARVAFYIRPVPAQPAA